jgi:hypothetical protein
MTEEGREREGFGCDPVEREPRAAIVDRSKIASLCKKRIACFDRRDKILVRFARDRMRRFVEGSIAVRPRHLRNAWKTGSAREIRFAD